MPTWIHSGYWAYARRPTQMSNPWIHLDRHEDRIVVRVRHLLILSSRYASGSPLSGVRL